MNQLEIIAKTIGYHFFAVSRDDSAIECGMDCAKEVIEALEDEGKENESK